MTDTIPVPPRGSEEDWNNFLRLSPLGQAEEIMVRAYSIRASVPRTYCDPRASRGDGCVYLNAESEPSCLIGHIFWRLGYQDLDLLSQQMHHYAVRPHVADVVGLGELSVPAFLVMVAMQAAQDEGATWSQAVSSGGQVLRVLQARTAFSW